MVMEEAAKTRQTKRNETKRDVECGIRIRYLASRIRIHVWKQRVRINVDEKHLGAHMTLIVHISSSGISRTYTIPRSRHSHSHPEFLLPIR